MHKDDVDIITEIGNRVGRIQGRWRTHPEELAEFARGVPVSFMLSNGFRIVIVSKDPDMVAAEERSRVEEERAQVEEELDAFDPDVEVAGFIPPIIDPEEGERWWLE